MESLHSRTERYTQLSHRKISIKGDLKMKNTYSAPEFKLILIEAQNILQTSKDNDPFVEDPFAPVE